MTQPRALPGSHLASSRSRLRPRYWLAGVFLLGAFLVTTSCSSPSTARQRTATPSIEAYGPLCEALRYARRGDLPSARQIFHDQAHQPLHELAERATEQDRSVAARLLEAKQRVEFIVDAPGADLEPSLAMLLEAIEAALEVTGTVDIPNCEA